MEYLKQFQNHVNHNDLPSLVSLWQEYCMSDEIDVEEAIAIFNLVEASPLKSSFGLYAEEFIPVWETLPPSSGKDECIKLVFDLQTTNSAELAEFAFNYLQSRYGEDPGFQQKLRLIGLRDKGAFPKVISNYLLLTHMKVGNFFIHTGGWGVGEVMDVSMLREQVTLEFDYVAGNKELSFSNAFNTLIPISDEHFLARRFGNPEKFEKFAKENPLETMRMLLKDLGPKNALEIKDELCELVIPEGDWAKWWQMTRTRMKKDTMIEVPSSLKDPFKLHKNEVSHEERLQKALAKKPDVATLIEMVYSFMRDFPAALKNNEFKEFLKLQLTEVLSHKEISDSQEIQLLFILQDLDHEKAKNLSSILSKFNNLVSIVGKVHVLSYKKRLLNEVKQLRDDWDKIFQDLLFTIDQNPLRDYLLEELLENKKTALIEAKIEELIETPNHSPQAFLWYFQKIMGNKKYPYATQEGKNRFFESFFILLHIMEQDSSAKEFIKKLHNFLSSGRFANVRKIFQESSLESVKEILLLSTKCLTLSDHDVKILHSLAEVVHPSLKDLRGVADDDDEHIIWTTQEGYNKVKERIERIATVETVENAKEIEVARSHGDLRENSEYKYAQEKRARLQSELKFLSEQLKHMRVLTKLDIDTEVVGIGTVVDLKSEDGKKISYTLLGPWDADPEKNILSMQSKLAQSLLGLKRGSSFTHQDTSYTVESIHSFI